MLIKMLFDRFEREVSSGLWRARKVYVAADDGGLREVIGVEQTLGGDLVILSEPRESVKFD